MLRVSVVIPTHNPRMYYLARVLEALRAQTLPREQWEIIVVDNGSKQSLRAAGPRDQETKRPRDREQSSVVSQKTNIVDLTWHPNARVVREEKLGLTFARLRGFAEAQGELIVMVDDDNVLAPDYLENAVKIAEEHKDLGAFGGKCLPEFETEPEPWMEEFLPLLALRDHGEKEIIAGDTRSADGSRRAYPDQAAPIGAGMVLRSSAARAYAKRLDQETKSLIDKKTKRLRDEQPSGANRRWPQGKQRESTPRANHKPLTDRKGDSLASAGDNDLVFTILRDGWNVGYFPQLKVTHLIPSSRLTVDYLARANRGVQRSWVEVLRKHDACPWTLIGRSTLALRKSKAWFANRAWSPGGKIRWNGCCGNFEGRVS
jgi:glycosyltransferase involved in cell wall biosynthesis